MSEIDFTKPDQAIMAFELSEKQRQELQAEIARLKEALIQALGYIESDEVTYGRKFGTGNVIRQALKESEEA